MTESIAVIDVDDNIIGYGDKMDVHQKGLLHRAFSIFVINPEKEILLQKRAKEKYHSGGLWTNTCCSHQREGEFLEEAAHRRLREEMGFDCELKEIFSFIYKVVFDNNLIEHELDHVLIGVFQEEPRINPDEAEDWRWISIDNLKKEISMAPQQFTYWFLEAIDGVMEYLKSSP